MTIHRSLAALLGLAMLSACGDSGIQDITAPAPGASVKFFNFGLNAPSVNFFANDTKLTATSSTSCTPPTPAACTTTGIEATTGVAYGSAGASGLYVGVTPGQYSVSGRIATPTDNGVAIATTSTNIESGKWYSYYVSGVYDAATKKADGFIVEDPIPTTIDPTRGYVRFVNAISNSSALTLFAKSATTGVEYPVGGAVAYKSAGAFTTLIGDIYDLNVRAAGSTANIITRTGVPFAPGRVYTISARGDITITSTTAANRPVLDNTSNR
ncbi:MAG: DUF4397 domain-containing protein [Gemmatirosa sp.]|nr:DUF4397 domain-containing protein [Gemmatirosa sp.]